jgi:hypothetical protein
MIARMRLSSTLVRAVGALLASAVLAAGCGGDASSSDDALPTGAGALIHVDGTLTVANDGNITLTPADGGEPYTFQIGPEVQRGTLRALEAAGQRARVNYRLSETTPIAVAVTSAPIIPEGTPTYEGMVRSITSEEIVIDGEDGERAFVIRPEDRIAFDVPHLTDHIEQKTPVRVYYEDARGGGLAIAYEDA